VIVDELVGPVTLAVSAGVGGILVGVAMIVWSIRRKP
jgi:hypothetical protein